MAKLTKQQVLDHIAHSGQKYDVIVLGGGPAGIGAALASAMCGAETCILEEKAFFGGVAAVSGWMPMNRVLLNGEMRGGVFTPFVEKLRSYGTGATRQGKTSWVDGDGLHIHPDYLRYGMIELFEDIGVRYRLHSPGTSAIMEGKRIIGVNCDGKYGHAEFYANVIIDASGDGDVAVSAGAEAMMGRDTDGAFMPVTLGFVISNVDYDRFYEYLGPEAVSPRFMDLMRKKEAEGYAVSGFYAFDKTTVPGVVSVNNSGQNGLGIINALNLDDLNVAERTGLQVAMDFIQIVHEEKIPGLENCELVRTGQALGVRETRRIRGDYVYDITDAQQGRSFPDAVLRRYGTVDTGGLKEEKNYHGSVQNGHDFPYRSLLPLGVEGMLIAGRCASQTHLGATTCKSMGNMMAMGQAAGVAAALSSQEGCTPRQLDVRKIQKKLHEMNAERF